MHILRFEAMTIASLAAARNVDVGTTMTTAGSTTGDDPGARQRRQAPVEALAAGAASCRREDSAARVR